MKTLYCISATKRKLFIQLILFCILFFLQNTFSYAIPISQENVFSYTSLSGNKPLKSYNNQVAKIIQYNKNYCKYYSYLYIYNSTHNKWTQLLDGTTITANDVDFDKRGNIWVAADEGLFKYDGKEWTKYFVDDSLSKFRTFTHLCIDSSNNVWVTAFSGLVKYADGDGGDSVTIFDTTYEELLKFDGDNFKGIEWLAGPSKVYCFGNGSENPLCTGRDGKVYFLIPSLKKNDLYIYKNDEKNVMTVPNPHYFDSYVEKSIKQILPDYDGNIWFALGNRGCSPDPGIVILDKNDNWKFITSSNGLQIWMYLDFFEDSTYVECNSIFQDHNTGTIYAGGQSFFKYFISKSNLNSGNNQIYDSDMYMVSPDSSFFNNSILYLSMRYNGSNSVVQDTTISQTIHDLLTTESHFGDVSEVKSIVGTNDGSIWMDIYPIGILRRMQNPNSVAANDENFDNIKIYPQPISKTEGIINIQIGQTLGNVQIKLFSITGNLISEKEVINSNNTIQITLPSTIGSGTYYLVVINDNKAYFNKIAIAN